jgi:hypothetical protein
MLAAMNRKRLFLVTSSLAAILAAIWLFAQSHGPTSQAAYDHIKQGISGDEVLAIMTDPPGNYATDFYTAVGGVEEGRRRGGRRLTWISDHAMIDVELDEQGRVCWKQFLNLETAKSAPQQLRRFWWSVKPQFLGPTP